MRHLFLLVLTAAALLAVPVIAWGDDILLIVEKPPADGLVVAQVDLTAAARRCNQTVEPAGIRATTGPAGQAVPIQLVPDADYRCRRSTLPALWSFAFRRPATAVCGLSSRPARRKMESWNGRVEMPGVSLVHDARRQGGFPSQITFADGKVFDSLRWNDRLYDRQLGGFSPTADPQAKVTLVSQGPLCTAVRVAGRYVQADGKAPPSAPQAVYDWLYLADRPLVLRPCHHHPEGTVLVAGNPLPGTGLSPRGFRPLGWRRAPGTGRVHRIEEELCHAAMGCDPRRDASHCHDAVRPGPALRWRAGHLFAGPRGCGLAGLERDPAGSVPHGFGSAAATQPVAAIRAATANLPTSAAGDRHDGSGPGASGKGRPRRRSLASAATAGGLVANGRGGTTGGPRAVRGGHAGGLRPAAERVDRVDRRQPGADSPADRGRHPPGQPVRYRITPPTARPQSPAAF